MIFTSLPYRKSRMRSRGVSLIITMIMVVIIGLTAAAAMRGTASSERVTNNMRMQNLAQQYAEAALRYCEAQIALADAARVNSLKEANITLSATATADWQKTATWVGGAARTTSVPSSQVKSADSSITPPKMPQCFAERLRLSDNSLVVAITARGFSPDYVANPTTGETTQGSVVWLQSILALN